MASYQADGDWVEVTEAGTDKDFILQNRGTAVDLLFHFGLNLFIGNGKPGIACGIDLRRVIHQHLQRALAAAEVETRRRAAERE